MDNNQNTRGLIAKRACNQGLSPLLAREAAGLTTNERLMRSEAASVWARVRPFVLGAHAFALADQAVASCASFLALVMIGRATSADELGVYAIAISILIWLQMSQEMLVTLPYTVQRHRPLGTPTEHAGSSLFLCGLLSAVTIVVLAATASGMSALNAPPNVISMTWVLAAVAPFALLREFGRRFSFAHLRAGTALVLDIAVAVTQLGLIAWFAQTGFLSATTALGAIGIGCAVTGATWLYFARRHFVISRHLLPRTMRESWSLGKWLLATQLTVTLEIQANYWLLAWIAGTAATGVYAACVSVASLANPVLIGSGNILNAKSALALKEGVAKLRSETGQASLLLGAGMMLFSLVLMLAGEDVMHLLYPGQEYAGHGSIIAVLALVPFAAALGAAPASALPSIGSSRELFLAGALGMSLTVVFAFCLIPEWGLQGAAYALLCGTTARSAARWLLFLIMIRRHAEVSS